MATPDSFEEFDHSSVFSRAVRLGRGAGWRNVCARATSSAWDQLVNPFDRKFGTETGQRVRQQDIAAEVGTATASSSANYQPIVAAAVRGVLADLDIEPVGTFIDVGAGKGRGVILGLEYGFPRAIGIEHSPSLCAVAKQNLDLYARKKPDHGGKIWEADATVAPLPADTSVLLVYNPFTTSVWQQMVDGPLADLPRPSTVLVHAMAHAADVRSDKVELSVVDTRWAAGRDFLIMRTQPLNGGADADTRRV